MFNYCIPMPSPYISGLHWKVLGLSEYHQLRWFWRQQAAAWSVQKWRSERCQVPSVFLAQTKPALFITKLSSMVKYHTFMTCKQWHNVHVMVTKINLKVDSEHLSYQYHEPTRSLRSSSSHQLSVSRHNLTSESRAFRLSAPRVWNSLPVSICETKSLPTFRRHLKTHYFQSVYPHSSVHLA